MRIILIQTIMKLIMSNKTIKIEDNYNFNDNKKLSFIDLTSKNSVLPALSGKNIRYNNQRINKIFKNNNKSLHYISFDKNKEKGDKDEELIFELRKDEENYLLRSGNYIGFIYDSDYNVEIVSRFGETFLKHILNYVSNIYVDEKENEADKSNQKNQFQFILAYLFVNKLEKASISGLPKSYKTIRYHNLKLKGNIDVNNYIKKDIPFKGKISTQKKELIEIEEIINVLACALDKIRKDYGDSLISKRLNNIRNELITKRTKIKVNKHYIKKAKKHRILSNPMFSKYKEILHYAESILLYYDYIPSSQDSKIKTTGYLINVAELFEIYVRKLLTRNFPDWKVDSPKLKYYNDLEHNIIPDIVMEKDGKVLVFDTKYKRIDTENLKSSPSFRNDFFQIHAYMYHYKENLLHGGLIYPGDGDKFNIKSADNKFHIFEIGAKEINKNEKDKTENNIQSNEKIFTEKIRELTLT